MFKENLLGAGRQHASDPQLLTLKKREPHQSRDCQGLWGDSDQEQQM